MKLKFVSHGQHLKRVSSDTLLLMQVSRVHTAERSQPRANAEWQNKLNAYIKSIRYERKMSYE